MRSHSRTEGLSLSATVLNFLICHSSSYIGWRYLAHKEGQEVGSIATKEGHNQTFDCILDINREPIASFFRSQTQQWNQRAINVATNIQSENFITHLRKLLCLSQFAAVLSLSTYHKGNTIYCHKTKAITIIPLPAYSTLTESLWLPHQQPSR